MGLNYSLLWRVFFKPVFDLVFPGICFYCRARIEDQDQFLCRSCRNDIAYYANPSCPVCGTINISHPNDCPFCNSETVYFDKCISLLPYNDVVRTLIHEMKYREKTLIADYLSERVIDFLETENPLSLMPGMRTDLENKHKNRIDIICPVPLHPTKKRERGYNQAALIADKLAGHFGWQYEPDLVTRTKFTLSQARLSPEQRKLNVNRAFSIDRKITIQDANILVIDDVFTTGATVNSLSRILREQGVKSIYVLTVARA